MLVVPRVVVGRRDGVAWITEFSHGDGVHAVRPVRPSGAVRYADGQLSVAGYRRAVAEAVRRMRAGELDKVVLAHDLLAVADAPSTPRHLLAGLAARYPACWSYSVDGLVGATPELLMRRRAGTVWSRVLAGTIWPGPDRREATSATRCSARRRTATSTSWRSARSSSRCGRCARALTVPAEPVPLVLHNVTHLASDVAGTLPAHEPASLLELAAAVHPTAAVGGTPREIAVPMIAALEGMDRGRYAGPVGWVDAGGDGELGIALRCAQLDGPVARLFAGCGIVADSDPDTEVREAAAKLLAVREVMEPGLSPCSGASARRSRPRGAAPRLDPRHALRATGPSSPGRSATTPTASRGSRSSPRGATRPPGTSAPRSSGGSGSSPCPGWRRGTTCRRGRSCGTTACSPRPRKPSGCSAW